MFSYHQESLYSFLNKEKAAIMKHLTASTQAFHEGTVVKDTKIVHCFSQLHNDKVKWLNIEVIIQLK